MGDFYMALRLAFILFHACAASSRDSHPCKNGGTVSTCKCPAAFAGNFCEAPNPCLSNPCQNGGKCKTFTAQKRTSYYCSCPSSHGGMQCECNTPDDVLQRNVRTCASKFNQGKPQSNSSVAADVNQSLKGLCQNVMNHLCCLSDKFSSCPIYLTTGIQRALYLYEYYYTLWNTSICGKPMEDILSFQSLKEGVECTNGVYTGKMPNLNSKVATCDMAVMQYRAINKCERVVVLNNQNQDRSPIRRFKCREMKKILCCIKLPMDVCPAFSSLLRIGGPGLPTTEYNICGFSSHSVVTGDRKVCADIWSKLPTVWPVLAGSTP